MKISVSKLRKMIRESLRSLKEAPEVLGVQSDPFPPSKRRGASRVDDMEPVVPTQRGGAGIAGKADPDSIFVDWDSLKPGSDFMPSKDVEPYDSGPMTMRGNAFAPPTRNVPDTTPMTMRSPSGKPLSVGSDSIPDTVLADDEENVETEFSPGPMTQAMPTQAMDSSMRRTRRRGMGEGMGSFANFVDDESPESMGAEEMAPASDLMGNLFDDWETGSDEGWHECPACGAESGDPHAVCDNCGEGEEPEPSFR